MAKKTAAAVAKPRGRGRPRFEPTDKQRGIVEALAALGMNQTVIAGYPDIQIDEKTLREYFRTELDYGLTKLLAGAVNQLGRMALGAPAIFDEKGNKIRDEVRPELGAICFLLKTKGKALGFSERIEHTGKDGDPISHNHTVIDEVDELIREELGSGKRQPATKH
ncbi:hypothetical protein [uncultured Devosia sp.]|uniref:hypothetical protein n=1 Tax=uncultured Devosia sp. TaxID=211434 RepID=UPI00260C0E1C|nr:hypothetical protein [uncultured Devosia sp.]